MIFQQNYDTAFTEQNIVFFSSNATSINELKFQHTIPTSIICNFNEMCRWTKVYLWIDTHKLIMLRSIIALPASIFFLNFWFSPVSFRMSSVCFAASCFICVCRPIMELFMNRSSTVDGAHSVAGTLNVYEQNESSEVLLYPPVTHKTTSSRQKR